MKCDQLDIAIRELPPEQLVKREPFFRDLFGKNGSMWKPIIEMAASRESGLLHIEGLDFVHKETGYPITLTA